MNDLRLSNSDVDPGAGDGTAKFFNIRLVTLEFLWITDSAVPKRDSATENKVTIL